MTRHRGKQRCMYKTDSQARNLQYVHVPEYRISRMSRHDEEKMKVHWTGSDKSPRSRRLGHRIPAQPCQAIYCESVVVLKESEQLIRRYTRTVLATSRLKRSSGRPE